MKVVVVVVVEARGCSASDQGRRMGDREADGESIQLPKIPTPPKVVFPTGC